MTDDQRKKYEEAAKAAFNERKSGNINLWTVNEDDPGALYWREVWMMGASHAAQDTEERVKQAHNDAIDKALETLKANWFSAKCHDLFNEIQKLKL